MQEFPEIAVQPTVETPTEVTIESTLTQEIAYLWSVHSQAQTVLGRTKEELKSVRLELGRRFYEMKLLLARRGRNGEWSKFLSAQSISRASADRWAKTYERTLNPPAEIDSHEAIQDSDSHEAIQDSTDEWVQKVIQSIWPKLGQVLLDQQTAYQFVSALVQRCDALQAEITDLGIAIRKPPTINAESSSGADETKQVVEGQSIRF